MKFYKQLKTTVPVETVRREVLHQLDHPSSHNKAFAVLRRSPSFRNSLCIYQVRKEKMGTNSKPVKFQHRAHKTRTVKWEYTLLLFEET